jgi:hypothetical protein
MSVLKFLVILILVGIIEGGSINRLGNNYLSSYTQNLEAVTFYQF